MQRELQYGASTASPQQAAAVLRALGKTNGADTRPAADLDLIAASYAAHLWCSAFNTTTLAYPKIHGTPAVRTLAAIVSRACGHRRGALSVPVCVPDDEAWKALAGDLSQHEQVGVLARVTEDLTFGGDQTLLQVVMKLRGDSTSAPEAAPEAYA